MLTFLNSLSAVRQIARFTASSMLVSITFLLALYRAGYARWQVSRLLPGRILSTKTKKGPVAFQFKAMDLLSS